MIGPLSYVDVALIAICGISGLLAMYRGLTREMLSILSWIVAALAAVYAAIGQPQLAKDVQQQLALPSDIIAKIAIGAVVFLLVLIVVHLITTRISDTILDSRIGVIDRSLGFVFGAVRGFVLVLIPFMFYQHFVPDEKQQYAFVTQSKSYGMLLSSGNALRPSLEQVMQRLQSKASGEQQG
jgi:membrane protein required for colicin V production